MATTPTSMIRRLMGLEAFTDALSLPAGTTLGGLTFDSPNRLVTVLAAATTLTLTIPLHAMKVVLLQSTGGLVITPPAATGTGDVYQLVFIASISGGSVTLDAKAGNASDVFGGVSCGGSSGGTAGTFGSASNSNLLTFNGTTTGGLVGTWLQMIDVASHVWAVDIGNVCSGTAATPFSNH